MIVDEDCPIHPVAVTVREGELHRLPYPFELHPWAVCFAEANKHHDLCLRSHRSCAAAIQDDVRGIVAQVDSVPPVQA